MKPMELKFGQEVQYSAKTLDVLPEYLTEKFIGIEVIEDSIYLKSPTSLYSLQMLIGDAEQLRSDFQYLKDKILVRIDAISGKDVNFTTFIFANGLQISEDMPLKLVVTTGFMEQLENLRVKTDDAVAFLQEQFLIGPYAFSFAKKNLDTVTLVGKDYIVTFVQNSQKILVAQEIRKFLANSGNQNIALLSGAIIFQNHLNNAQLLHKLEKKYEQHVQDNEELLQLWELYGKLEYSILQEESEEVGIVAYHEAIEFIDENGRHCIQFNVSERPTSNFLSNSLGYAIRLSENDYKRSLFIGSKIESVKKINDNEFVVTMRKENTNALIAPKGYLCGSIMGSKIMQDRRQKALQTILQCDSALPTLKYIVQAGEGSDNIAKPKKIITDSLAKKIFNDNSRSFTLKQERAIGVAINSNDMAIIQGPPGTGKTTVIRAIVERINNINDGRVNILISSAQHDAVDNAIGKMEYGGLPVHRIGGKMGEDDLKRSRNIINWLENVQVTTEQLLGKLDKQLFYKTVRKIYGVLQDIYMYEDDQQFVLKKLGELSLLVKMLPDVEPQIIESIDGMMKQLNASKMATNEQSELDQLLLGQRLTLISFLDDGVFQLTKLMHYYRMEEPDTEIPDIWMEMRMAEESEEFERLFPLFKQSIESRLDAIQGNDLNELNTYDQLFQYTKAALQKYFDSRPKTIVDVLTSFQDDLESPSNINEIISKYTKINASTCQQAVSKKSRQKFSDMKYDYVIIDEAARANPLDLLIPMSLGKKIILVGDHKQLPHILEDEVVTKLIDQLKDLHVKELLKNSLFERLFELLDRRKHEFGVRTAMLTEQYRMHPAIGSFVSEMFYEGKLENGVTAEQRKNSLLRYKQKPVVWLDVANDKGKEYGTQKESKYRPAEIERLQQELYAVIQETKQETIGIITFYKRQLIEIEKMVKQFPEVDQQRIDVGTVDSFQGKEFDIVFLSTVRSNKRREVGFVSNANRLNVAFSRAKRVLAVIGDSETICGTEEKPIIPAFMQFETLCKKEGHYDK